MGHWSVFAVQQVEGHLRNIYFCHKNSKNGKNVVHSRRFAVKQNQSWNRIKDKHLQNLTCCPNRSIIPITDSCPLMFFHVTRSLACCSLNMKDFLLIWIFVWVHNLTWNISFHIFQLNWYVTGPLTQFTIGLNAP